MTILLGMLLGALLVLGAALTSIWLQQRSATRAEVDPGTPAPTPREASP